DIIGNRFFGNLGLAGLPKMLLIDHSMAFPRLLWIFILPILVLYGYSANIIFYSIILMYLFYVFIELSNTFFTYWLVDKELRTMILDNISYAISLPIYRLFLFYFRVSGFLVALQEPPSWDVPGPVASFKNGVNNMGKKLGGATAAFLGFLGGWNLMIRNFSLQSLTPIFNIKGKLSGIKREIFNIPVKARTNMGSAFKAIPVNPGNLKVRLDIFFNLTMATLIVLNEKTRDLLVRAYYLPIIFLGILTFVFNNASILQKRILNSLNVLKLKVVRVFAMLLFFFWGYL
ncbi:MAG: hypothetical protein KAS39_05970, partial [Actinomycetia bacterium]|nr:hypothetical protein [Actinomycetes bacterium]